jgi:hypothetical protein
MGMLRMLINYYDMAENFEAWGSHIPIHLQDITEVEVKYLKMDRPDAN